MTVLVLCGPALVFIGTAVLVILGRLRLARMQVEPQDIVLLAAAMTALGAGYAIRSRLRLSRRT